MASSQSVKVINCFVLLAPVVAKASSAEEFVEEAPRAFAQWLLGLAPLARLLAWEEDGGEGDAELQADLTDDPHQQLVHVVV